MGAVIFWLHIVSRRLPNRPFKDQSDIPDDGNKKKLQVVFISVDPKRDIGKLDQFAGAFNPTFLGLTAHQDELMSISSSLGVYHEVVESQKLALEDHSNHDHGDHYDIDHTSSYLLFNPELKLTALLTSPHEPIAMAKAIDIIIENLR